METSAGRTEGVREVFRRQRGVSDKVGAKLKQRQETHLAAAPLPGPS